MTSCQAITIDLSSTKDFYNLVGALNRTFGHGKWTCRGRPVRKLRRVEKIRVGVKRWTAPIVFYLPFHVDGIESFLKLHLEKI